jgi:hypothetical protein
VSAEAAAKVENSCTIIDSGKFDKLVDLRRGCIQSFLREHPRLKRCPEIAVLEPIFRFSLLHSRTPFSNTQ